MSGSSEELGDDVLFRVTDIRDDGQIEQLARETADRFGGIDISGTWRARSTTGSRHRAKTGSSPST